MGAFLRAVTIGLVASAGAAEDAGSDVDAVVAVVANPAVTVDSLSRGELLDYYTGDIQRWPDGTHVAVTDLKARGPVRDRFYDYLGKRPSRMKSIWLRRMLSGEGEPPEVLDTEAEVLQHVAATPGAIGYVDRERVDASVRLLLLIDAARGAPPDEP